MRFRIHVLAAMCGAAMLASAVEPAIASAQGRVAVRVAPRRSVVVSARYYRPYRPLFYDPWYGIGYPWYPTYYGYQRPYYDLAGSLRLQVAPRETEVFIDGYFAGTVDDFDGIFQSLNVEPGEHDIELYLPGHRSLQQKLYLQPGKTSRIRHTMQPIAPGDPQPIRPAGVRAAPQDAPPQSRGPVRRGPGPASRNPRDRAPVGDPGDTATGSRDANYGGLSLRVQPGDASVLIDGERWEGPGNDERLVVQLAAGRHVIEIQKDGFRQYTTEVTVRTGETATLNVALTKQE